MTLLEELKELEAKKEATRDIIEQAELADKIKLIKAKITEGEVNKPKPSVSYVKEVAARIDHTEKNSLKSGDVMTTGSSFVTTI